MIIEKTLCCNRRMQAMLHESKGGCSQRLNEIREHIIGIINDVSSHDGVIVQSQPAFVESGKTGEVFELYKDLTEYECACNEIYVDVCEGDNLADIILELKQDIECALAEKFKEREFCIIISVDNGECRGINAWFHLMRDHEFYIDKCVDNYEQPVLYAIIET